MVTRWLDILYYGLLNSLLLVLGGLRPPSRHTAPLKGWNNVIVLLKCRLTLNRQWKDGMCLLGKLWYSIHSVKLRFELLLYGRMEFESWFGYSCCNVVSLLAQCFTDDIKMYTTEVLLPFFSYPILFIGNHHWLVFSIVMVSWPRNLVNSLFSFTVNK